MENNSEKKTRKLNKKVLPVLAVGVILGILLVVFVMSNFMPYTIAEPVTIPPATLSEHDFTVFNNQLLLINTKGVQAYNASGDYKWDYAIKTASPIMIAKGNRFTVADTENATITSLLKKKQNYSIENSTPVTGIVMNSKGYTGIISSEHGYRSVLSVYDDFGNEHYKWYSGEGYITAAAIHDNEKDLAATTFFASENNVTCTSIHFFDMKKAEPVAEVILENEIAYKLIYEGQKLYVLTDKAVRSYSKKGVEKASYPFYGRTLHAFSFESSNDMAVALSRTDSAGSMLSGSDVFFLEKNLKVKGSASTPFEVSSMDFKDGLAAVTGIRNVWLITSNGKIKAKSELKGDCERILMFENKDGFATLSGSNATVYPIH